VKSSGKGKPGEKAKINVKLKINLKEEIKVNVNLEVYCTDLRTDSDFCFIHH
jgi:hypothetical protein